jgi:hypothetical protein
VDLDASTATGVGARSGRLAAPANRFGAARFECTALEATPGATGADESGRSGTRSDEAAGQHRDLQLADLRSRLVEVLRTHDPVDALELTMLCADSSGATVERVVPALE